MTIRTNASASRMMAITQPPTNTDAAAMSSRAPVDERRLPFDAPADAIADAIRDVGPVGVKPGRTAARYVRMRALGAVLATDLLRHVHLDALELFICVTHPITDDDPIVIAGLVCGDAQGAIHLERDLSDPHPPVLTIVVQGEEACRAARPLLDAIASAHGARVEEETAEMRWSELGLSLGLTAAERVLRGGVAQGTLVAMCESPWAWIREIAVADRTHLVRRRRKPGSGIGCRASSGGQ